ncbi:Uncharacterized protein ToN1_09390 [Aromatoleum petrolei]|nr:Uncharacterized protein ToN1_09390 [Aromatoleum petrolei]
MPAPGPSPATGATGPSPFRLRDLYSAWIAIAVAQWQRKPDSRENCTHQPNKRCLIPGHPT